MNSKASVAYEFNSKEFSRETEHHCHAPEERAWLFHSLDSGSTEEEYLQLLYSVVYCLKPISVIETGAFAGIGTVFMAKALRKNGIGKIVSLEIAPKIAALAKKQIEVNGVSEWAQVITADSKDFLRHTHLTFDFAFFDSMLEDRCEELRICLERKLLLPGSFFAIHDTSRLRVVQPGQPDPITVEHWKEFETIPGIKWLQFPLSRGMTLGQVQ